MIAADVRLCFLGDSFTQGVGDALALGWVGRVTARAKAEGHRLTAYNLGVRRETGPDVERRWLAEVTPRLRDGECFGIVLAFGVNDTAVEDGRQRVSTEETLETLDRVAAGAAGAGWRLLVVGPAFVSDPEHNERILDLSAAMAARCDAAELAYVEVASGLVGDEAWLSDVANVDGSHPSANGYEYLADRVWPVFRAWITAP